jgi:uncharacterized protein
MRKTMFILFFSIFLTAYTLINFYIFLKGWQALSVLPTLRMVYAIVFFILYASFIGGRFLERVNISWFSTSLVWIGSFWLAAMVYFFFFVVAVDLLRLLNYIVPFYPACITGHLQTVKYAVLSFAVLAVSVAVIAGYLNAKTPRVKNLEVTVDKSANGIKSLNIAMASDIHLGTIITQGRLEHIIDEINSLDPDVVLLPGDVIDEDLGPVISNNLGETLRKIKSKYGVYAVTGNHEYIGGVEPACKYLSDHGITMLRDKTVLIQNSFYIVGREDISSRQLGSGRRRDLKELLDGIDNKLPVIMMDHQPFRLEDAVNNHIDLQLSGHTHHGQMWPFNYITESVYELSWGYLKKGNTQFYVSCGAGTWGPPVRIGNTPEIINIHMKFVN